AGYPVIYIISHEETRVLVQVETTYPWRQTTAIHRGVVRRGVLKVGATVTAEVDEARRLSIQRNHTATHLLHWALRQVLGEHALQSGSVVDPDRLRFDFAHYEAVSPEQLRDIETLVNDKILRNVPVRATTMPFDEAKKQGAIALFGEKYGDEVRVLQIGDFSKELCGGTHVSRTGDIGSVLIVHEGSVAAGTRRMEAVSGLAAAQRAQRDRALLTEVSRQLNCPPEEAPERVAAQRDAIRELQKQIERLQRGGAELDVAGLAASAEEVNGIRLVAAEVPVQRVEGLRSVVDAVVARLGKGVGVLGAVQDGRVLLVAKASKEAVAAGVHAGNLIREVARACGGGGGGKPEFAQAGGKQPDRLKEALAIAKEVLRSQVRG
ncbi:MAG: DHHA1 domain-containing protein, partial [Armatimonadota bacterium]